jgi:hypothetical protein
LRVLGDREASHVLLKGELELPELESEDRDLLETGIL